MTCSKPPKRVGAPPPTWSRVLPRKRGWGRYGDRQLYQAVNRLAEESSDSQLRVLFSAASALYSNVNENRMPREMVSENLAQVSQFLDKLEGLA